VSVDLPAARAFMAGNARLLDRRRFDRLVDDRDPGAVLAGLAGYRNPDGGYGWGLEPDLRAPESQPGCALHAFEEFADAAHRVAAHDPAVAEHPWLDQGTSYCLRAIEALDDAPHALVLNASLQFLDAAHDTHPEAADLIERLGGLIPDGGLLPVGGGIEGERIRPLDIAPLPDRPVRELFGSDLITAELQRLAGEQQDDGGWTVDFQSYSPAAALEWRGYVTVQAALILTRN
jgi:hypothetical protein